MMMTQNNDSNAENGGKANGRARSAGMAIDNTNEDGDNANDDAAKSAGMVIWTRRAAFFLGFCAFIVMFLVSYDFTDFMSGKVMAVALIKGACAFLLFWVAGLVIGNITLKGLVADVPVEQSHLTDGGILQRIYLYQQRLNYDTDGNVIQIDPTNDTIVRKKN